MEPRLLILCCVLILLVPDVQSCNITIDSVLSEGTSSSNTRLNWPWTIRVDSTNGEDINNCLTNQTVRCKTLHFVLNNIIKFSTQSTCLKLVLLSKNSSIHVIPNSAPHLSGINLYFFSEEDAVITCENNTGNAATAWSIQNASFVVFKSLQFSNCNQRLEVANVTHVYFENVTVSKFSDSGLRLFNNFNITLKNLSVMNCLHRFTDHFPENSALSLVYRSSGQKLSHVQILNSQFHYNSIETAKIEGTSRAIIGDNYPGRGGALGIFINEPIVNTAVEMVIDKCNFTNNRAAAYGGAVYIHSNQLSSGHNLTLTNSIFDRNFAANGGGGIAQGSTKTGNFSIDTVFTPSHYLLANCNFTQNTAQFGGGGSFTIAFDRKETTDIVSISNCIFGGNVGMNIGAAIMFSSLALPHLPEQDIRYKISNCTFKSNASPRGILGVVYKDLEFYGTNHFISNVGPSIRAADSNIAIHGNINFLDNIAVFFDGVIQVQDFVQFQLYSGSHMYFHNNSGITASVFSIFLHEYPRVFSQLVHNPWCFLLHEDVEKPPSNWTDVSITFDNNIAYLAPNIYMSNFKLCSWQNTSDRQVHFSDEEVMNWPVFNYHNFIRVNATTPDETNANHSESFKRGISTAAINIFGAETCTARPGQPFTLDIVPLDSFGNPTAFVFGFTQLTEDGGVPSGRLAKYIDLSDNYKKDVVLEPNIKEYLPGQRSVELRYGLSLENPSLRNFTIAVFAAVKVDVSDVPIKYINVTVETCLPGHTLRKANSDSMFFTCECDFKGISGSIISCETDEVVILKDGLFAFNRSNQIFSTLKVLPCPPTYCQCRKERGNSTLCSAVYNYSNEEQQCHPDREGILCGRCRHDHQGVGVLTMLCQNCDSDNVIFLPIVLLVLFDVALVILILYSATPFPPSLKGILFYIQAMSYAATSFPLSTWRGNKYMLYISSALSLYFPWDFCLYEGMTALASHLFSYIPFIVAIIIITVVLKYRPRGYTSPKGKKFQEIYSKFRSKCAHGIWTLVLLMFLRVSYNPWLITDCVTVTDNGLSWYWDGNVQCFSNYQHILLFFFGVIVLLFTSGLMIFIGLLTVGALGIVTDKYATYRHLRESASYGYKDKYQWWPFVDIGRRFLLVFYWVRFPTNSTLQIFIFFTIFLVQVYAQPYKKAWHNWLDSFLTAYIVILLSLRSTNFIIRSLLPNAYPGVMLPRESTYHDEMSSPSVNPLPPSDALTYFFVPLLYLPLAIGVGIIGRYVILWLYNCLLYCFRKCKKFRDMDAYNKSELDSNSTHRIYKHGDKEVLVTRSDGRTSKVTVTYAEF